MTYKSSDSKVASIKIIAGTAGGNISGLEKYTFNGDEIILLTGSKYKFSAPPSQTENFLSNFVYTKSALTGTEEETIYTYPLINNPVPIFSDPVILNNGNLVFQESSYLYSAASGYSTKIAFTELTLEGLKLGTNTEIATYSTPGIGSSSFSNILSNKYGDRIIRNGEQLRSFGTHPWTTIIPDSNNLMSVASGQFNDGSALIVGESGIKKFPFAGIEGGVGYQTDGKTSITKIKADGAIAWIKNFDFGILGEDYFIANIDDQNGDFMLAGSLQDNLGTGSLINFTADGTQKWRLDLTDLPQSRISSASLDVLGNIYICGTCQFDWIWKSYSDMAKGIPPTTDTGKNLSFYGMVSKDGQLQWINTYGDGTGNMYGNEIFVSINGNIILAGTSQNKETLGTIPNVGSNSTGYPYSYGYLAELSIPQSQIKYATIKTTASEIISSLNSSPAATSLPNDLVSENLLRVTASTWDDTIKVNRIQRQSDSGGKIEAKQIDFAAGEVAGSVISGGNGNDDIKGFAGWDFLDGGAGDDLIHGGNGRDILAGGTGRDELHGDFGWNTYRSEKDGVSDLIAIKSDQFLVNWLYGKAGNSPNGEKSDIIESLDPIDKIKIIGVDTSEITFVANVATKGVTGIGIYGKGILEALYTGGDLTLAQIQSMTSGDASAAAMSNSINSYGTW